MILWYQKNLKLYELKDMYECHSDSDSDLFYFLYLAGNLKHNI